MKGCVFHWTQAVMRKVGEVGLKTTYDRRAGAHHVIRKLLALPFLPASDIPRAFEKLLQKVDSSSTEMTALFSYVKDQWLGSSLWPCEEWSIYRQVVRTNNDVEGITINISFDISPIINIILRYFIRNDVLCQIYC